MQSRSDLENELQTLAREARERRSVDRFTRAALEGLGWATLSGVIGKLVWDSARLPFALLPLGLLDLALFYDALRSYLRARRDLVRELRLEARVRQLRVELGIDPAEAA
jgi:hypothetical protein